VRLITVEEKNLGKMMDTWGKRDKAGESKVNGRSEEARRRATGMPGRSDIIGREE